VHSACKQHPIPKNQAGDPFGETLPQVPHLPSSWFLTTSTAFSARGLWLYCMPQPTMGFVVFRPFLPSPLDAGGNSFPRRRPFEAFPSSVADTVSPRSPALLSLPRDCVISTDHLK